MQLALTTAGLRKGSVITEVTSADPADLGSGIGSPRFKM